MIVVRMVAAVVLLFSALALEIISAHVLDIVFRRLITYLRTFLHRFMARHGRLKRLRVALILLYRLAGTRSTFYAVCAAFAFQCFILLKMKYTTDPDAFVGSSLLVVGCAVVASLVLLHRTRLYSWFYGSPFAKGVWGLTAAIALWYGHSLTKTELAWAYGVAGPQLTAAFQVGTFVRTVGILAILLAVPACALEIAFMAAMFDSRKYAPITRMRRRRTLIAVYAVYIATYMGVQIAAIPAANEAYVDAVLADTAWLADTYPEKACTGVESADTRRIVFANSSASDALVFEGPSSRQINAVRKWKANDALAAKMRLVGIDHGCKKYAPPGTAPLGIAAAPSHS